MSSGPIDPRLLRLPRVRRYAVAVVISGTATALLIVVQADALARLLAGAVHARLDRPALLALPVVLALRALVQLTAGWLAAGTAAGVKAELRSAVLAAASARGPGWLAGRRAGELSTVVGRGVDGLDAYLTGYLPQLVLGVVVPVAVLVRLAWADPPSAIVIAVTLPLIPIFAALVGWQSAARTRRQWGLLSRLGGHFLDMLGGLGTLRAFGRARAQVEVVRVMADRYRAATMATLRIAFLSALVLELVATLSVALVAVPVGLRLLDGSLTLPVALLVLLLAPEAYLPLRAAGAQFHASQEGLAAATDVFAVLSTVDPPRTGPVPPPGDIVFDHVTVRGLTDISFTVRPGERIALVGPSGAGKSTILALLLGFLAPDAGRILVGGVDLSTVDADAWRDGLAWVPQRPHLFAASVADNIRLGDPAAPLTAVRATARAAQADGFIDDLPAGYDTVLGERGVGLSSGQGQRVALARAFRRTDAGLVLLDEPTARLDAANEAAVLEASLRLVAGRTAVVVAHRPALRTVADRVLEVRAGTVREIPAGPVPAGSGEATCAG